MEKIKTILGILAIGFLIYLYMNYFPVIASKIQQALLGSQVNIPQKVQTQPKKIKKEKKAEKKNNIFKSIDEIDYEKKAEEEIDRLLNLQ